MLRVAVALASLFLLAALACGQGGPVPVGQAAAHMTVPEGFHVSLFAGEPDVVQPIATCFDDRGRLWVVENFSYPNWITDGKSGHDRVLIFDDPDGTGHFKSRKVFLDNGTNLSGIEVGFGGVWLCSTPNLIYIPLDESGDKPAGAPQILLDGWSLQAKHNVFNRLTWGPDGWLYGCNGILETSYVGKPGTPQNQRTPINCGVWRYHPTKRQFEVFASGTTNPWGLDFDDRGQMFITNCVIKHLFHVVQGAHFQRMFGQDLNPNVYGLIESCADHIHWAGGDWTTSRGGYGAHSEAGGGHAHAGCMVYLGDNWPESYRNGVFMCNIHGSRVNHDILERKGSGYVAHHGKDFLFANDPWFRGLDLHYGPDGGVFVMDWCDTGECHNYTSIDQTNGRIYKVTYGNAPLADVSHLDLAKMSDAELVHLQLHRNEWFARHARRVLQERSATGSVSAASKPALWKILSDETDVLHRLRALWTLHAIGGLAAADELKLLSDAEPSVRAWTVQLAMEKQSPSVALLGKLAEMARTETSPVVRLYLASALQRIAVQDRGAIAAALAGHAGDASDSNIPLMIWYGMEPIAGADISGALSMLPQARIPVLREFMARRTASQPGAIERLVQLLASNSDRLVQRDVLRGMDQALAEQRELPAPANWPAVYKKLSGSSDREIQEKATFLAVLFGDQTALAKLRRRVLDQSADPQSRQRALEALVRHRDGHLPDLLQRILSDHSMASSALKALADCPGDQTPRAIFSAYSDLDVAQKRDAINTLASRPQWATAMLDAVASGQIPRTDVSTVVIRQLATLNDPSVNDKLAKVWGSVRWTAEDKRNLIARFRATYTPGRASEGRCPPWPRLVQQDVRPVPHPLRQRRPRRPQPHRLAARQSRLPV